MKESTPPSTSTGEAATSLAPAVRSFTDAGITIAQAAAIIGSDPSTVRELVRIGQLEAWRVGKTTKPRGVRVSEGACWDYRRRNAIAGTAGPAPAPEPQRRPRPSRHTAVLNRTLDSLRAKGVRV